MKIAALLKSIGHNQTTYNCIKSINRLVADNYEHDYMIFFEDMFKTPIKPACGCFNICDFWSYKGVIIFTKLDQYLLLNKTPLPTTKIFYPQDLEWMEMFDYETNYKIYNEVDKLVCRSEYHSQAIEEYCGRKPDLIEPSFNIEKML